MTHTSTTNEPVHGGRLTQIGPRVKRRALFLCECGTQKSILVYNVLSGATRSCGCFHTERRPNISRAANTRHGKFGTVEHYAWASMIQRCENPKASGYKHWGGRGIAVCNRWRHGESGMGGFECFFADMGHRPATKHSLDRINNDGNYEPGNCRWATYKEQANNTRRKRAA